MGLPLNLLRVSYCPVADIEGAAFCIRYRKVPNRRELAACIPSQSTNFVIRTFS